MTGTRTETEAGRKRLIEELRELIDALDSRLPQLEREGETRIAGRGGGAQREGGQANRATRGLSP